MIHEETRFQVRVLARKIKNLNISICRGFGERVKKFFNNCIRMFYHLNEYLTLCLARVVNSCFWDFWYLHLFWAMMVGSFAVFPRRADGTMNPSSWGSSYCSSKLGLQLAFSVSLFIIHATTYHAKKRRRKNVSPK